HGEPLQPEGDALRPLHRHAHQPSSQEAGNGPHPVQDRPRRGIPILPDERGGERLRSLFARILLWFLATTAITGLSLIVTRSLSLNAASGQPAPFTRTIPYLLVEARHAYESGGPQALADLLERVR